MRYAVMLFLLAGCATTEGRWNKPGATNEGFHMDRGFCVAQMSSVSFAPPVQQATIFAGCMQGKGWYWEEVPIRR